MNAQGTRRKGARERETGARESKQRSFFFFFFFVSREREKVFFNDSFFFSSSSLLSLSPLPRLSPPSSLSFFPSVPFFFQPNKNPGKYENVTLLHTSADGRAVKAFDSNFPNKERKIRNIEFRKERRFKSYSARTFFFFFSFLVGMSSREKEREVELERERESAGGGAGGRRWKVEGRGFEEAKKSQPLPVFFFFPDRLASSFLSSSFLFTSLKFNNARLRPSAAGHRRGLPVRRLR